jgi:glycosyltransferase involved in cell wall biosynthesis
VNFPKISIVTTTYNSEEFLEETILSIVNQGYPNLEYIIIDAGSLDKTTEIIKKNEDKISYWISEKDNGLYEGLQKGFDKSTGEIMGWLNADDLLHKNSLFAIAAIFNDNTVNWVQGYPTIINESGITVNHNTHIYSKYHFYLKKYIHGEFIQQESTFWRRNLWNKAGAYISTEYKYASDFELWIRFFRFNELVCTNTLLGGYRVRKEQMSRVFYEEYINECNQIINMEPLSLSAKNSINAIKKLENSTKNIPFLKPLLKKKLNHLFGKKKMINFNFEKNKFVKE